MIKSISKLSDCGPYMFVGLTQWGEKCFETELCKRIKGEKLELNETQGFHTSLNWNGLKQDIINSGLRKEVIGNLLLN